MIEKIEMTYETAINRLEEIVLKLEDGTLPLKESLELFEEGTKLSAFCNTYLDTAELKISQFSDLVTEEGM